MRISASSPRTFAFKVNNDIDIDIVDIDVVAAGVVLFIQD